MAGKKKKKMIRKKKVSKPSSSPKRRSKKARKPPVRVRTTYNTKGFDKYRVVLASIKKYYQESGKPISNAEALKLYHELKGQFKNVQLRFIEDGVGEYLAGKERKNFPSALLAFTWYLMVDVFTNNEAVGFFKPTDKIVFDLSLLGLEEFEFEYGEDIYKKYRDLYAIVKPAVKNKFSPEPQLRYVAVQDDVYTWELYASQETLTGEEPDSDIPETPSGPAATPTPGTPDREIKRLELEVELEKQKQKTADKILELVKAGFSRAEAMKIMGIK